MDLSSGFFKPKPPICFYGKIGNSHNLIYRNPIFGCSCMDDVQRRKQSLLAGDKQADPRAEGQE